MIPELAILMLACARMIIHSSIFGSFSVIYFWKMNDYESEYIITTDEGVRFGKTIL